MCIWFPWEDTVSEGGDSDSQCGLLPLLRFRPACYHCGHHHVCTMYMCMSLCLHAINGLWQLTKGKSRINLIMIKLWPQKILDGSLRPSGTTLWEPEFLVAHRTCSLPVWLSSCETWESGSSRECERKFLIPKKRQKKEVVLFFLWRLPCQCESWSCCSHFVTNKGPHPEDKEIFKGLWSAWETFLNSILHVLWEWLFRTLAYFYWGHYFCLLSKHSLGLVIKHPNSLQVSPPFSHALYADLHMRMCRCITLPCCLEAGPLTEPKCHCLFQADRPVSCLPPPAWDFRCTQPCWPFTWGLAQSPCWQSKRPYHWAIFLALPVFSFFYSLVSSLKFFSSPLFKHTCNFSKPIKLY